MTQERPRKEQIREAAYRCFQQSGYHKTTVDVICQQADCSKGSFYWHYPSKQDVYLDILRTWAREVISELFNQFEEVMAQDKVISPLTGALQNELRRGRTIGPLWVEFSSQSRHNPEIQEGIAKFYRRARAAITDILRPITSDVLTEDELEGVSSTIFGAYLGLMIQEMVAPDELNAQDAMAQVMTVIGRYLFPQE